MSKVAKSSFRSSHNSQPKNESIWFDSDEFESITSDHFEPEYWHKNHSIIGSALGRGTTYFFAHAGSEFVLRHYRRGGLIGKLLTDQYLYTGLSNTRAWQEMSLLLKLKELTLPAPTPVAARVTKNLFYYQADIITKKIPHAQDVHQHLLTEPLSAEIWECIGATIAKFHTNQIYHHDLNIHNIMLDKDDKVWLIDFDKCATRNGEKWKKENLDRLARSLKKEKNKHSEYHFKDENWDALKSGYSSS